MHFSERSTCILGRLREMGNSLIVVEHDEETIRAADFIVDMGPGAGEHGGEVMYAGPIAGFAAAGKSLTSAYVYGRRGIERRPARIRWAGFLLVHRITLNNLAGINLRLPLNRLTVVSGVSGSGKSSLVVDALAPILRRELEGVANGQPAPHLRPDPRAWTGSSACSWSASRPSARIPAPARPPISASWPWCAACSPPCPRRGSGAMARAASATMCAAGAARLARAWACRSCR